MFWLPKVLRSFSISYRYPLQKSGKHFGVLRCFGNESSQMDESSEIKIPVPYGHIAAKAWGSDNGVPILALHGWLDNCGTFDRLLPQLPQSHYYVALDLPGHGFSSHRPPGCYYTYLDMVTDIKRVVKYFAWEKFSIIGHSMGGEIALMWTSIFPTTIDKLVLLDVCKPFSHHFSKLQECAQTSIDGNLDLDIKLSKPPPVYTPEKALKRLIEGMNDEITQDSAQILLKRGSKPCENGLVFTRDLRIRYIEPYNVISHEAAKVFVSNITCDILILSAENSGPRFKSPCPEEDKHFVDIYKKNCKRFILESIDDNHFMHLNNPTRISPLVSKFLES